MKKRLRPRRYLAHLALALGAGVFAGRYVPPHPLWTAGLALSLLLAALLKRKKASLYPAAMVAALFVGLLRCGYAAHPALPPAGEYQVRARVYGEAQSRAEDGRVTAYLENVVLTDGAGRVYSQRGAYWTYWPEEGMALPLDGQQAQFEGQVYHPSARQNPHGFDFRLYLLQKGIGIGVSGAKELALLPAEQKTAANIWLRIRQSLRERLRLLLGEDAALAETLILNDKRDMPEDMTESFRTAGVAHVLAVSGLHVMILFSLARRLLERFHPSQGLLLLLTGMLMALYCLIVGAQSAMLRACILLFYTQLGRVKRRRTDGLTAVALAFMTILLLRPLELFAAGFQLSFAAVLGMLMLGDRIWRATARIRNRRLRALVRVYGVTLCANLATALPVGWYYHRLSLIGLAINPLLCAAVSVLLPVLLGVLALSYLYLPAALALGKGAAWLSHMLTAFVAFAADAPLASVAVPRLPVYAMAALVLCMVLTTRYTLLRRRWRLALGAGALGLSGLIMLLSAPRGVRYLQLAVGNADAAILEDGRQTVVIDAGEYGGDLAEYLLSTGRRADMVILTHLHGDHALGLKELLREGVEIGCVYLSGEARTTPVSPQCLAVLDAAQEQGIEIKTLCAGDCLDTGRVRIDVLWPEAGGGNALGDANDFALALRISMEDAVLLHMSDVSGAYEMYAAQAADVLKVAHHGSSSSTGERFLMAVRPQIALLSTRRECVQTRERLVQAGAVIYDTGERGALMLTVRQGQIRIRGYIR